jgi:hypothetical protein
VKYRASKTEPWSWYAGEPFLAVNTHTVDIELISLEGTDNFLAHTTINAAGVPTVTVDTVRPECAGEPLPAPHQRFLDSPQAEQGRELREPASQ